jgi:hypothetical protein
VGDAYSSLTSGDFMKIIFTELTNQDPLSPSETKDLLEQISTIRAIESDIDLGERLESMAKQNEITSSSSLVGKFVTGKTSAGADTAGYVDSVSITREGPILNLSSNTRVPLKNLTEVVDPTLLEGATSNDPPALNAAIADQTAARGAEWSFTVPRTTFADEDVDGLTYTATLEDGSELPEWMRFNATSRVLSGTPPDVGSSPLRIRVSAIDAFNERASSVFTLTLGDSGEAP